MLDIYLINESDSDPKCPDELEYIDGLELEEHVLLNEVFIEAKRIGIHLSLFNNSRLSYKDVCAVLILLSEYYQNYIKKGEEHRLAIEKMTRVFSIASNRNMGLIAYCD